MNNRYRDVTGVRVPLRRSCLLGFPQGLYAPSCAHRFMKRPYKIYFFFLFNKLPKLNTPKPNKLNVEPGSGTA